MSRASKENFADKPFTYYVKKFQRRIFRRLVEYRVLSENLGKDMPRVKPSVIDLLCISESVVEGVEVKDHVENACLTGLKAEFELFFIIYCNLVLDHLLRQIETQRRLPEDHQGLLKVIQDKRKFFDVFLGSGMQNARQLFIAQAVPSHGLERLSGRRSPSLLLAHRVSK